MVKSSTPGAYYQILKPVIETIKLSDEIDRLLDIWDNYEFEDAKRNSAYSKSVHLARRQLELMG